MTELVHYGTPRHSGRYPWGSGDNPAQRNKDLLDYVADLKKKGLTETKIAEGLGMTTTQLRAAKSIAKTEKRRDDQTTAMKLKEKGLANTAIAERMGINESSVRALLDPSAQERADRLASTADMLKEHVASKKYIDIGAGNESGLGISGTKFNTAVAVLEQEGYKVYYVKTPQVGTGKMTTVKVLAAPGTSYSEVYKNQDKIATISAFTTDGGHTWPRIQHPLSIDSKRVGVRYAEEGGTEADGVIYVRPGVSDVSLGGRRYAQVRIAVDGTHYLKGMAVYKDDLPDGVDLVFNTNKSNTGNKLDAMKKMKDDPDNPFGSSIKRQIIDINSKGEERVSSVMNIVNEEGDWALWSRNLSSQMLSKQSPKLAKDQLALTYATKKAQYDEIMALTNPSVKRKLLESFADDMDSSSVHLKAAGLPRTATHVILPVPSLSETEIYAPKYRNGEKVVLIRHPHGGTFEIPELTVNNRHPEARTLLGQAQDAVGINAKVAQRLSGADFDGDTVLVIPNNSRKVKISSPLAGLKDFDPKTSYGPYDGMRTIDGGTWRDATKSVDYGTGKPSGRTKQLKMGDVSNLITDMTIKGASQEEIARAVRHSMVVIDAEKHSLDYKRSAKDNGIAELKTKYQGSARSGASTLISRASSDIRVEKRTPRRASEGGPVDPVTGEKVFVKTGESYTDKNGRLIVKRDKSTKMAEAKDARSLSSGTPMEEVYAEHANSLKALANQARKQALAAKPLPYSPSARETYDPQVKSLNAKLNLALQNAPLERQAQLLANATISAKRAANPDMDAADLKKIKGQALKEARERTGAKKQRIDITPDEWDAIQAGAITPNKLRQVLLNTDLDKIKQLATPHSNTVMNAPTMARAKAMLAAGFTQAEIADQLGVPASTVNTALGREES